MRIGVLGPEGTYSEKAARLWSSVAESLLEMSPITTQERPGAAGGLFVRANSISLFRVA